MTSATVSSSFCYEALPETKGFIRLLEVQGFDEAGGVKCQCRLTIWRLAHAPKYHAISYAWGDATQTEFIHINGELHRVRSSCLYVLKQAYWHGGSRYHWVDAICINQSNDDEKGCQVQMMGDIFRRADRVLACVGAPTDDSDFLWRMLWKYRGHPSSSVEYQPNTPSSKSTCWPLLKWKGSIPYLDIRRLLTSYSAFAKRPYFSRVWVA